MLFVFSAFIRRNVLTVAVGLVHRGQQGFINVYYRNLS